MQRERIKMDLFMKSLLVVAFIMSSLCTVASIAVLVMVWGG
jgi:hypothetical protein